MMNPKSDRMTAIENSIAEQQTNLAQLCEQHALTYAFNPETDDGKIAKMLLLDKIDQGVETARAEVRELRFRLEIATIDFLALPPVADEALALGPREVVRAASAS